MIPRRHFLTRFFDLLESKGIRYCVLRNYENIFDDDTSDVDLILEPADVGRFCECLHAAAAETEYRLVHRARYVDQSWTFCGPGNSFVRMDFETEARWRVFPVLSARAILESRRKRENFYVPDAYFEAALLFLQVLWRGHLSDRYRARLVALYEQCPDKGRLREVLVEAFGRAGGAVAELHSRMATGDFSRALCSQIRRAIILRALSQPARARGLMGNILADAGRLWERLRRPAGISLLFASSAPESGSFDELMRGLEMLFPPQKRLIQRMDATREPVRAAQWKLGDRVRRWRVLFKGGLFARHIRVGVDTGLRRVSASHPRHGYLSHAFMWTEDSRRNSCLAHAGTGFMAEFATVGKTESSARFAEFIATILAKEDQAAARPKAGRGVFAVIIGLDGSGKTTMARNVCRMAAETGRFAGVRYFHWRPAIFGAIEFPLPDYRDTPRKPPAAKGVVNSVLSALRLLKNIFLANIAYFWRVRPLARRNHLVLIDRYFYNYLLDPDSVRYAGPAWLLKVLLPLFPKPDAVITLDADAATLLARKRELSAEQMAVQIQLKDGLDFGAAGHIALDAREPAAKVAENALAALAQFPLITQRRKGAETQSRGPED